MSCESFRVKGLYVITLMSSHISQNFGLNFNNISSQKKDET